MDPSRQICTLIAAIALFVSADATAQTPSYDIVYVRQARYGDNTNTTWPEVFHPARLDPGADLMLLHPDGSEEVLVAGGVGGVTDPFVSFDGKWVYYAYFYDLRDQSLNYQRGDLPYYGADIFRIHVQSRVTEQLTFGEFTPNTGAGNWDETNPLDPPPEYNRLGYGILNLGPAPVAGGRVAFTSNRNGFEPPKGYTNPTLQLFVMDENGDNVTPIAPMNISSSLHPTPLRDGRLMFSTHESQALRDRRLWGIWSIYPDGRHWAPVISAFRDAQAFHFMTQLSNTDIVLVDYYNLNNNGFGALYRMPIAPPPGTPAFHSAFPAENPSIDQTVGAGFSYPFTMPFTPWGMVSITPFTHGNDEAAPVGQGGVRVGKFTHPSGAPDNHLLVVWTPGPANDLNRPSPLPYYDSGLYLIPNGDIVGSPSELVLIKNDPMFNEAWPRALVPYSSIHGVAEPAEIPWLPNDGTVHSELPEGTPYGLIGTSSFYKRESFPGRVTSWSNTFDGLDAFNTGENGQSDNWFTQGSDAGRYDDSEIWAVRILAMEANTHRSYGPNNGRHFSSHADERLRILGEIPLRKFDGGGQPILDAEGNPDTSFLAKVPADTPFTFQTINGDGMLLNMSQTWHQVRPGEMRADCGGCHAHSQQPLDFDTTEAASSGYEIFDLSKQTPLLTRDQSGRVDLTISSEPVVNVEFLQDIRPILQASCVPCHTGGDAAPGNLDLSDTTMVGSLPGDYKRLAADPDADWGYPPIINNGTWRQTNASRYIRMFQSRRSLLVWKLFGERLDGWSNADHPTEASAGDQATLPGGADPNEADLDYTGDVMPPPGGPVPALTTDQKLMFVRWIDLGCPIETGQGSAADYGWMLDDHRPTVTVSSPRAGHHPGAVDRLQFGLSDAYTGVDMATLSVVADFPVSGRPANTQLADLASSIGDGIYEIDFGGPMSPNGSAHIRVEVKDGEGNVTRVERAFSTLTDLFTDGFESGDPSAWTNSTP